MKELMKEAELGINSAMQTTDSSFSCIGQLLSTMDLNECFLFEKSLLVSAPKICNIYVLGNNIFMSCPRQSEMYDNPNDCFDSNVDETVHGHICRKVALRQGEVIIANQVSELIKIQSLKLMADCMKIQYVVTLSNAQKR